MFPGVFSVRLTVGRYKPVAEHHLFLVFRRLIEHINIGGSGIHHCGCSVGISHGGPSRILYPGSWRDPAGHILDVHLGVGRTGMEFLR